MIRVEQESDYRAVEYLTREAFWNLYEQGANEHLLLHNLRKSKDFIHQLSLLYEEQHQIIAHIAYSHSYVHYQDGKVLPTVTFGPVSVNPSKQLKGIGSKLIRYSINKAKDMGFKCIIIQGYPDYYSRFGFKCTKEVNICLQDHQFYRATMYLELQQGYLTGQLGVFHQSQLFGNLSQEQLQQFQKQFDYKEKYNTLSQQIFTIVSQLKWNEELPANHKEAFNREKLVSQ